MSQYDPSVVTHVITEAGKGGTAKQLGLKSIMEIPNHIPTVLWSWIVAGAKLPIRRKPVEPGAPLGTLGEQLPVKLPTAWHHSAFSDRLEAGDDFDWGSKLLATKGKGSERTISAQDQSRIS